jgi:hypothetical protein
LRRYRYRTTVLAGPWRETEAEAANDAVRARQAIADVDQLSGFRWIVPGTIEEQVIEDMPKRRAG